MNKLNFVIGVIVGVIIISLIAYTYRVSHPSWCSGPMCVSNPINELISTIQKSQAGVVATSQSICLAAGEGFGTAALSTNLNNVASITFNCNSGAAVCDASEWSTPYITVEEDRIEANLDARFKGKVMCFPSGDEYDCTIGILNA